MNPRPELRLVRLPVSGNTVALRMPSGAEELMLLESSEDDLRLALTLAQHLATESEVDGEHFFSNLTITDLDIILLQLRRATLGDRIQAELLCGTSECEARIDIAFSIQGYVTHHFADAAESHKRLSLKASESEPGWFQIERASKKATSRSDDANERAISPDNSMLHFRLPTVMDVLTVADENDPVNAIALRCIKDPVDRRDQRRIESAMQSLAPNLSQELTGVCPDCGAEVTAFFHVRRYCLSELRNAASFIYEDVDLLASRYHWSESDILSLPIRRRTNYAEFARQEAAR